MSKIIKYMSKKSRDVIFLEKKAPAGMPTHRTGVDNIKNPLKLIQIHSKSLNPLKCIKINQKCLKSISQNPKSYLPQNPKSVFL